MRIWVRDASLQGMILCRVGAGITLSSSGVEGMMKACAVGVAMPSRYKLEPETTIGSGASNNWIGELVSTQTCHPK